MEFCVIDAFWKFRKILLFYREPKKCPILPLQFEKVLIEAYIVLSSAVLHQLPFHTLFILFPPPNRGAIWENLKNISAHRSSFWRMGIHFLILYAQFILKHIYVKVSHGVAEFTGYQLRTSREDSAPHFSWLSLGKTWREQWKIIKKGSRSHVTGWEGLNIH